MDESIRFSVSQSDWHEIATTCGIVESVSELMFLTEVPRIRTLCGVVIQLIQQRGIESEENIDWKFLLQHLIQILFNQDVQISETGKQSLLRGIGVKSEIIKSLIELDIFDKTAEQLEITFSIQNFSQSSVDSQTTYILPQACLLNILEVVERIICTSSELGKKVTRLKICAERISRSKPPRWIKGVISSIISMLEDEQENEIDQLDQQTSIQQIQLHEREISEQLRQANDQVRISEERARLADEQLRTSQERAQLMEQLYNITRQSKDASQEREMAKDVAILRLQTQVDQLKAENTELLLQNAQFQPHVPIHLEIPFHNNRQLDLTSELENIDPSGQNVRFDRINGLFRRAVAQQQKISLVIPLNKVIRDGIHRCKVRFENCNGDEYANIFVGIVKADYQIPCPCNPRLNPNNQSMVAYTGFSSHVYYKDIETEGNDHFSDDQLIEMELNMITGTLHFFVDGIQQPVFVHGINGAVKFYV
ncbi:MAG: hypothetical protein EZS28_022834 [Streblomastix strix]|uniref:SPRY domain-containing protein n=1 Tax=Streblomastix strix TaxID=222440 RepID=A0A5J4VGY8_9EUKA|nr:MAG: hypothetical protein EZS28_022834 [Streblomastix strix]